MDGALRRLLKGWKISDFDSIDQAMDSLYKIVLLVRHEPSP